MMRYGISTFVVTIINAVLLMSSSMSFANDAASKKKERQLDEIYQKYHSAPTDLGVWEYVRANAKLKSYKTQKGDTLIELSEMLFGDSGYWPKIWSLNKNIQDPYNVPPGTIITFVGGTKEDAPTVTISEAPEWIPPPDVRMDALSYMLNAEIPDPAVKSVPLLPELPSSLPNWKQVEPRNNSQIDTSSMPKTIVTTLKYFDSYIGDRYTEAEGAVIGTELDMTTASEFQYVFVRMYNSKYKKYLVVRDGGEVKDDFTGKKGYVTEILGEIEISEIVDPKKQTYRAIVKKNIGQISKDAKLIYAEVPTYRFNDIGVIKNTDARIIGGQYGQNRKIFGQDGIVYLNKGNSDSVEVGTILPIYEYQLGPTNSDIVKMNPRPIGKMKVIHAASAFSTAVILESNREVQVGDGTSRMAAPSLEETEVKSSEPLSESTQVPDVPADIPSEATPQNTPTDAPTEKVPPPQLEELPSPQSP